MGEPPTAEDAWAAVGPFLSGSQIGARLRVSSLQLDALVAAGGLIVLVERSGARRYPAWQLDADRRPLAALVASHRVLVEQGAISPWSAASWCVHAHPELGAVSPRAWAHDGRDPRHLMRVASRDAARAAQ